MKRKVFKFSLMLGISLLAFGVVGGVTACNSGGSSSSSTISLDKTVLNLNLGDSAQLTASLPKSGGTVRWYSDNSQIAEVTGKGRVFAKGVGETDVHALLNNAEAVCHVVVTDSGTISSESLTLNATSKSLKVGDTFTLTATVRPEDTTVTFSSSNAGVASINASGLSAVVTAVATGSATISAVGSNGKSANCNITVTEQGGGGGEGPDTSGRDIAVDSNLGLSGSLEVGSPLNQIDFMKGLLADFNKLTNSNVSFTVLQFEENNGTSGYKDASGMPAIFPYASDQTLTLYQFGALSKVANSDATWIKTNMGQAAFDAAKLQSVVGFPFAADNGLVMFYNKSLASENEINTIDKLFAKATAGGYTVNYNVGDGFYGAGALMTFTGGKSLYKLNPTATSYTSSSTFASAEGIKGAKLIRSITGQARLRNATAAPTNKVLATITDVSKVQNFKSAMGDNYAVCALPYVDEAQTTRLATYLGYKFYGINNTCTSDEKTIASAVAKFLCSEYSQAKRFDEYNVRPTLIKLVDYAANEPHVAALTLQAAANATIPLTATSSELWSGVGTAVTEIKALAENATDAQYTSILETLDATCTKTA